MNVALFLTPKNEVITLTVNYTIKEALDVMKEHRYTSVPVIDKRGHYVRTISEGDLLWYIQEHHNRTMDELSLMPLKKIKPHYKHEAVCIDAKMKKLYDLVLRQSFVPVVDDANIFIGIVKRSEFLQSVLHEYMDEVDDKVS